MQRACHVLGRPFIGRHWGCSAQHTHRWTADPRFTADTLDNPLDKVQSILAELANHGETEAVESALVLLAEHSPFQVVPKNTPPTDPDMTVQNGALDTLSRVNLLLELARGGEHPLVVEQEAAKAKSELDAFAARYRQHHAETEGRAAFCLSKPSGGLWARLLGRGKG